MDQTVVDFVKLGYAGASLDFEVHVRDVGTFGACVRAIGGYNQFDAERVVKAFGGAVFGEYMGYTVGRAGSPLIVVEIPFWTQQALKAKAGMGENRPFTDEERGEMAATVRGIGRELQADEITVSETRLNGKAAPYGVRLWWD
ncbi:hypothetical protein [Streptosporangium sp. NPDC048865]|uniref:hypothetical protein n=1 Tax=Streptosporangium sp. NPDC048865 TaxID=3155766 RepID=UPI00341A98AE